MIPFIIGLIIGGLVGFAICAVFCLTRDNKSSSAQESGDARK